jgi:hypothetical protein
VNPSCETSSAPQRDDPVTREERVRELMEEFRTNDSNQRAAIAAATANARVARDRAIDIRARGRDAAIRAARALKKTHTK